jgi:hypothetical protein
LHDVLHALEQELGIVRGDSGAGEHLRVVVGDRAVAGPLAEEGWTCRLLVLWREKGIARGYGKRVWTATHP